MIFYSVYYLNNVSVRGAFGGPTGNVGQEWIWVYKLYARSKKKKSCYKKFVLHIYCFLHIYVSFIAAWPNSLNTSYQTRQIVNISINFSRPTQDVP